MLLHYTTFLSELEPYRAAPIRTVTDNLQTRKPQQTFALSILYFTEFVKHLTRVADVHPSQSNYDSNSCRLPANYAAKSK